MCKYLKKGWQPSLTNFLLLLMIALIITVSWRIIQLVYTPNLLTNPGFEVADRQGWEIVSHGNAHATPKLSPTEPDNTILSLEIPAAPEESWIGIGQQIPIEPGQPYKAGLNYRLAQESESTAKVILRVVQRDQSGAIIKSDEITSPDPLLTKPINGNQQSTWNLLLYNFVAQKDTTMVEIGGGLFGQQATVIEIDDMALKANPGWFKVLWQDPIIRVLLVLLVSVSGYKLLSRVFASLAAKKPALSLNRQLIAIITVNLILLFVFAELLALGIYFIQDRELFYTNTNKKVYELIGQEETKEVTRRRIHPYFGYVDKPGLVRKPTSRMWGIVEGSQQNINNHGFVSDYDYPFIKNDEDQYIIGIFGGSIAEVFSVAGQEELLESLKQDDLFADKEIIVLNFAKGGYKQPQQFLIVAHFLLIGQEFDAVINIDGFNEVTLGERNNRDNLTISMPSTSVMKGLSKLASQITTEEVESLAKINRYKTQLNQLAQKINNNKIASPNFILEQYYAFILNNYGQEINSFDQLEAPSQAETSLLFTKSSEKKLADPLLYAEIAQIWADSSIMTNQLLSSKDIAYFHILQPDQFYSNNRVFSEDEAAIALNDTHSFKLVVEKGYPVLIEKSKLLTENEVNFYSAIHIFDAEPRTVYIDDCCHYTQLGNNLLADFIATSILESPDFYGQ